MNKTPSANIVDNSLVLSLPNAINPVVWRMELSKAKMSAIEIREDKLGDFTLVLKNPQGDVNEIARFGGKNEALKGLNAISNAMSKAEKTESKEAKSSKANKSLLKTIMIIILSLFGFIVALMLISSFIVAITGAGLDPSTNAALIGGATQEGIPQSADDFLRAQ